MTGVIVLPGAVISWYTDFSRGGSWRNSHPEPPVFLLFFQSCFLVKSVEHWLREWDVLLGVEMCGPGEEDKWASKAGSSWGSTETTNDSASLAGCTHTWWQTNKFMCLPQQLGLADPWGLLQQFSCKEHALGIPQRRTHPCSTGTCASAEKSQSNCFFMLRNPKHCPHKCNGNDTVSLLIGWSDCLSKNYV